MTPTQPQLDLARRSPDAYPCGECGEVVTARQLHTYLHCILYKNRVNPVDYGLVIVRREDWEKRP